MRSARICCSLVVLTAAAPTFNSSAQAGKVATLMSADVEEYSAAVAGFKSAVGHQVVAEYDMEGDFEKGEQLLAKIETEAKPDLILAVGIWALQLIVERGVDVPVVYAMVLNPPSVLGDDTRKITGASINVSVDRSLKLFTQVGASLRRIGVIYNPSRTGFLVAEASALARQRKLQLIPKEIQSTKGALPALQSLAEERVDALWVLPDETILAPAVIEQMLLFSYRNRIPLLGLSERQVEMGALLALSFGSSEDIGKQAGEIANLILEGRNAAQIPYTTAREVHLTVNLKAAERLGVRIPEQILVKAHKLIR